VLEYSELIVIAFVAIGAFGGWVSHTWTTDSIAGGREIWGPPKEMAEFTGGERVVRQGKPATVQSQLQPPKLPRPSGGDTG